MEELRELEMFTEKWTHFKISLSEEGKIDFAFAYIPKDDYWPGLFMKGVSGQSLGRDIKKKIQVI